MSAEIISLVSVPYLTDIFSPSRGKDIQNLVKFLYTGRASLNEGDFEVFQQLVFEFQIGLDENAAIILEEITTENEKSNSDESQVYSQLKFNYIFIFIKFIPYFIYFFLIGG